MQALMTGVPVAVVSASTTGAATGTPFAIPINSYNAVSFLPVPTGSVTGYDYSLYASVDGVTYVALATGLTTISDLQSAGQVLNYPIARLDQVTRSGGTSQAVYATLTPY